MAPRRILKTYYGRLKPLGNTRFFHGGSILPPNMSLEPDVRLRCPRNSYGVTNGSLSSTHAHSLWSRAAALPWYQSAPHQAFPDGAEDNLRWYAFAPEMSLDYIQEETMSRVKKDPSAVIRPTLYVYKIKAPIRNLLLFADRSMDAMGGAQNILENDVCHVAYDASTSEGRAMKERADALGAPINEYIRAAGITKYRFMRGDRGEHANGWVRINSIGLNLETNSWRPRGSSSS